MIGVIEIFPNVKNKPISFVLKEQRSECLNKAMKNVLYEKVFMMALSELSIIHFIQIHTTVIKFQLNEITQHYFKELSNGTTEKIMH